MRKPKVIISHPGRQHSHQTAYALQVGGMLERYFTSIWYKPNVFPYNWNKYIPINSLIGELKKRYFKPLDESLIVQIPKYEFFEQIVRLFSKLTSQKFMCWINERFDQEVSKRMKTMDFNMFIGYETSSLECFRVAKKRNKICILDLAAVHYTFQRKIWDMVGLDPFEEDAHLKARVERRKKEELDMADYIFTPSEYAKNTFLATGISEKKIFKIPYGYDLELFKPKRSYRTSGPFKILYTGSMTKRKGIHYLLRVLKELNLKDAELILIGGMADGVDVLKQYNGLYKYIPFLHHEELVKYYQDADIFVFPSLLDSFAMVVIEAMACGTPVIVSEYTGAKDVVRDGLDGFITPIMNGDILKEKILFFYKNRNKLAEMGRNASAQVKHYTWEEYRHRVRDVILHIWDNTQRRSY